MGNSKVMNWGEIAAIVSILGAFLGLALWFVTDQTDKGLLRLQAQIAEWRAKDKEEMRTWINGSFMRSGEVTARMDGVSHRVDALERG